ncbi:hypothetical protein FGIG_02506 [Fasciola gigantica]|uniref:Uncharacterized protein n=1 Tax=Fasciola gigantica TaxID=46835 RepID=A0A504Z048_FASGI|nr:hypothetical protein FGIG_02506 [Fasciola gigantica]
MLPFQTRNGLLEFFQHHLQIQNAQSCIPDNTSIHIRKLPFVLQVILPNLRLQYAAPRYYSCPEEAKLGACEAAILNIQYNLMMPGDVDLTSASPSVRDSTIQPLLGYHDGKSLSLSAPTALPAPPCGTILSSNTTFMPVTSNSLNLPGAPTSAESAPNNTTASTLSRTVPDSSMLVSLPNIVSSNHRDPIGSHTVMGSGPNVTPSSGQQTTVGSCTPSASNLPDQNQNGSTRTETVRTDKIALASNAATTSRPCAYFCAQANSTFNASQFGSPANPQLMCAPTQSNTAAGIAIQPNLASSMPQVAYAPYASYRTIPGPPPVAPFQSINYPSCSAFTGNYMLPVGSNVVTSAPAFLPIPLQNAGSNASNALGLLQTQSNGLPISTPSNISTQATIALNSSVVLPDCPSHLAMNGYEYSPLIPGSLATTNLVNPYGNPSAYLVDSNTVLMGSNGQLSGLPSVVTMPQTSVSGTTDLIHHASIGQSGPLSTSQVPQTGLYRLSLPVHAVQTPSTQLNSVTQNQAALLGLLSQTQTQSVLPSHSSNSCPTGSVSAAQTIPATGSQSINVPAAV